MRTGKVATVVAVVFAVTAAVLCYKLLSKHITGSSGSAWFDAGCSDRGGAGGADCAAVLASPYSYWPPKKPAEPPGKPHIPVAFLGMVYYSVLAVWMIGIGCPSRSLRWLHFAPLLLVGFGLAGSAFFMYVMFSKLNEWCPWCVVTHGLNLGLAVCLVLMWPRTGSANSTAAPGVHALVASRPSFRLAMLTVLAVIVAAAGENQLYGKMAYEKALLSYKQGMDQCLAAVERLKSDTDALVESWRKETPSSIEIDSNDPVRLRHADSAMPIELVVFSDFECPSCRKFALFLDKEVEPLFGGNLKTVFKHYPLNAHCNPATQSLMHRQACNAAKYAEAARVVGGNAAFWSVHDYLFRNQEKLKAGEITPDALALQTGIDPKALLEAMESVSVIERIKRDALQGRDLGVNGTPLAFLAGRRVDNIARDEIKFWDRMADQYWKNRKVERPESTQRSHLKDTGKMPGLHQDPATPGTPDPTNGP